MLGSLASGPESAALKVHPDREERDRDLAAAADVCKPEGVPRARSKSVG